MQSIKTNAETIGEIGNHTAQLYYEEKDTPCAAYAVMQRHGEASNVTLILATIAEGVL